MEKYIPTQIFNEEFFNTIKDHRVYFNDNFFSRQLICEIQTGNPYLEMNLEYKNNEYILKVTF